MRLDTIIGAKGVSHRHAHELVERAVGALNFWLGTTECERHTGADRVIPHGHRKRATAIARKCGLANGRGNVHLLLTEILQSDVAADFEKEEHERKEHLGPVLSAQSEELPQQAGFTPTRTE
jgi:hypothetical protein